MRRHWNNKGRIIKSPQPPFGKGGRGGILVFCSMLLTLCYLLYPKGASSGPYLNSAHGNYNPGYGVLRRTSLSTPPTTMAKATVFTAMSSIQVLVGLSLLQQVVNLNYMNYFNHYLLIKVVLFATVVIKTQVSRNNFQCLTSITIVA